MAWVAGGGEREEKEGREKGSDDAPARVSLGGDVLGDSEVDWPPELRPAAESAIHAMRRESPASQLLGSRRSFALRGSEGAAAGTEAAQGPGAGGADGGSEGRGEGATSKASSQAGTWKPMAQEVDMESALSGAALGAEREEVG